MAIPPGAVLPEPQQRLVLIRVKTYRLQRSTCRANSGEFHQTNSPAILPAMDVHVSLLGRGDLSREIYRQLREAVLDGRLRPGERLPPSRELARRLSVSRMTVTAAYDRLAIEGFVQSRIGAGTFVREHVAQPVRRTRKSGVRGVLQPRQVWETIRTSSAFVRPARYDFRSGLPDASLFPNDAWRRLVARQLGRRTIAGAYGDPAGDAGLREAIARHIGVSRGVRVAADDVTITNGTQQGLDILARVLLGPGDQVAVENPGYLPPRFLFRSLGIHVAGVPVDADGLVVGALPPRTRAVYTTPSHQYPLGLTMTLPRRMALIAWAERNRAAIIEDDYDSEFRFGGRPIEPLWTLDGGRRVVYVGSFSKTMLPTLRMGFIITPPSLRDAVRRAKFVADWHSPLFVQQALARFIDSGDFARHIRRMNRVYQARHEIVMQTLETELGEHLEAVPASVGLHVCARARTVSLEDIRTIVDRAFEAGVAVQELARMGGLPDELPGLVLGYGAVATEDIRRGLLLLRRCFDG